ncbi:hypothetical protein GDO86_017793 [Hymenochirus boettgeri]|uniref:G-protein coupled receptors family 1 profile domain-containing protein n=1 Tax=Hymenochirus boettgeri TaxID=247094 RepID=A0A8T2IKY2_9PIPI|nr:hypothetical protein GDO86_017793 [Hymenochirus boettgeri]
MENQTTVFILVLSGLSDLPSLQLPLFLVFLLVYLMTLTGNLLIVLLICTDSHLQTPMYFFLGTLACLDMGYSSVTTPRMLFDFHTQKRLISIQACITQIYFFVFFLISELVLLAVMSYDRYVAICRPLHYTQIMHWKTCVLLLLLVSCSDTFINVLLIIVCGIFLAGAIFALTFCPYIIILNIMLVKVLIIQTSHNHCNKLLLKLTGSTTTL